MVDHSKIEAMEYIRKMGGPTQEQCEFADFQVGFPRDMGWDRIYIAYVAAKYGPDQVSMDTQTPEEFYT